MKIRFIIYAILAIILQVMLGYYTGQGQGGIAMLLFTIFIEIDPTFSITSLFKTKKDDENEKKI